jgi:hypothetical protein
MTPTPTTTVVNVRSPEWKAAVEAGTAVYIGRRCGKFPGSTYGNPYKVGADGTRDEVVAMYKHDWHAQLTAEPGAVPFREMIEALRGKVLGCWCAPKRCHGDALVELLEVRKWA